MSLVQSVFSKISTAVFEDKVFNLAVKVTNMYKFFTLSSDSYQREIGDISSSLISR